MAIGIKVGSVISEVGTSTFFNAFFSTIVGLLENNIRGSLYPLISKKFYNGHLNSEDVEKAITELKSIQTALTQYPPTAIIWDLEDRSKKPPWGNNISPKIISLANYFISSTGRDLFELLFETFHYSLKKKMHIDIV